MANLGQAIKARTRLKKMRAEGVIADTQEKGETPEVKPLPEVDQVNTVTQTNDPETIQDVPEKPTVAPAKKNNQVFENFKTG